MANLILAKSYVSSKSGAQLWQVYRLNDGEKSQEFNFYEPLKAMRYAMMLRKRGGFMPKAVYNKLLAEVRANKAGQVCEL